MIKWLKKQLDIIGSPTLDWVQVEITTHCDSACIYCPHTLLGNRCEDRHMSIEVFTRIIPYLKYTDLVYLQGWGEPLLNSFIFEMIRMCKRFNKRVGFTTNGMLLTDQTIEQLVELELDIISISLAGTTPTTHNRIRKGTDFDQIFSNLKRLRKIKAEKKSDKPDMHLSYLMLRSNLDELSEVVPLAEMIAARQIVSSHPALILDKSINKESLFNNTDSIDAYRKILKGIEDEATLKEILFAYPDPKLKTFSSTCSENVYQACVISVAGEVCPCVYTNPSFLKNSGRDDQNSPCYLYQGRSVPVKTISFGNIQSESLTQIWNKKEYSNFRAHFDPEAWGNRQAPPGLPQECLTCHKGRGA